MIGKLIFKLPEEQLEFQLAQRSGAAESALEDVDNWLRNKAKYEDQDTVTIDEVRKYIRERKDYWEVP